MGCSFSLCRCVCVCARIHTCAVKSWNFANPWFAGIGLHSRVQYCYCLLLFLSVLVLLYNCFLVYDLYTGCRRWGWTPTCTLLKMTVNTELIGETCIQWKRLVRRILLCSTFTCCMSMLGDVADPIHSWIKHHIKYFVLFLKFYDHRETFVDLSYMYFLHLSNFKGQSVSGTGHVVVST